MMRARPLVLKICGNADSGELKALCGFLARFQRAEWGGGADQGARKTRPPG